ncbi:MAG: hypothetical protein AB8G05_14995 [Oligoflexales bacterium]
MLKKVLCIVFALLAHQSYGKPSPSPEPKQLMRAIFARISYLIPLSFDQQKFSDKTDNAVQIQIDALGKSSAELETLGTQHGDDFHYLAKNLHKDIKDVKKYYDEGRYQQSAFILQNLTENCFACHSKYENHGKTPSPQHFYKALGFSNLPADEKARILVITRQFGAAQKAYEQLLLKELNRSFSVLEPAIEQYLAISVGVLRDYDAPLACFEKLIEADRLDISTASILKGWIGDLKLIKNEKSYVNQDLGTLEKLIAKAKLKTDHVHDKRGLVYWTAIKSLLNHLSRQKFPPQVETDIYYWLGVTATMFEHSFWIAQMPFYLEKSIRLATNYETALRAFTLLEKNITLGYTGSGGTFIPYEEKEKINKLRSLVLNKKGSPNQLKKSTKRF